MIKALTISKISSMIPKKFKYFIALVEEDAELIEVVLRNGFYNSDAETVWVFSKERYERSEYTLNQIKEDLICWLDSVKPIEV